MTSCRGEQAPAYPPWPAPPPPPHGPDRPRSAALTKRLRDVSVGGVVSEGGLGPVVLPCRLMLCNYRVCWSGGLSRSPG